MGPDECIDFDSISELIPKAKLGNKRAFNGLLVELQGQLISLAKRRLNPGIGSKEGHSDIVQRTLIEAVESFDSFRGDSAAEFSAWIQAILENVVKQTHRAYGAQKREVKREQQLNESKAMQLKASQRSPGTLAQVEEELQRFHDELDALPKDYAEVIRLRSLEKLSFHEVATARSVSVGNPSCEDT